jgi:hypothetical protein
LGPKGGSTPGGSKVVEVGPVPPFAAPEYLLRIIQSGGPGGAKTPVHTHPGSEAFYVLAGEQAQRTPHGVTRLEVGQSMPGHGPDTPYGSLEQRDDRSGSVCDVPGGRHQAIHVTSGVSVSPAVILPVVRTSPTQPLPDNVNVHFSK